MDNFPPDAAAPAPMFTPFTLRDLTLKVAELLGQGMTNAQIAEHLELSESTVRLHVSTILDKLDLSNRTQVALLAAQTSDMDLDNGFVSAR